MTGPQRTAASDERLLREALAVVRSARERAPSDFLVALAIALGALVVALVALGLVADGGIRDVALDLAVEVAGAVLTVVLVDGLWTRQQTGAAERLRRMEARLQARIDTSPGPMTAAERDGWAGFIEEYRDLTARATVRDRVRATRGFGRRARDLEEHGEQLLAI